MGRSALVLAALLVGFAPPAAAQAWDAPSFLPPNAGNTLGAYYIAPDRGDFGLFAMWRQRGDVNLGVRAGIVDTDQFGVIVGADASDRILDRSAGAPLDVAWTLGFGATIDEGSVIRLPLGATAGRRFDGGRWALLPYVHPRLALEATTRDDRSDLEVAFTLDLGADLAIGRRWLVRAGIAIGDRDAVGIGVAWRIGRPVEVAD